MPQGPHRTCDGAGIKKFGEKAKSSEKIIELILADNAISGSELADKTGISERAVEKHLANLRNSGVLRRIGPAKGGRWEVLNLRNGRK